MNRAHASFALLSSSMLALAVGCSSSNTDLGTGGGGGSGGTQSSTSSKASTGTGTTSSTSTATGTSTSTASGSSSSTGGGTTGDHLLISEVAVAPEANEFFEIWNPTNAAVALDDYYVSDNSTYYALASGGAWNPVTSNPGTDFLARFPAGTTIAPNGVLVVGFDTGYFAAYGSCPDFYMGTAPLPCNGQMVPTMVPTETGSIVDTSNLSNAREMIVLFTWDGNTAHTLKDVDYVTWGDMFEAGSRADKTAVSGYQPDTAPANQKGAPAPANFHSSERCSAEPGEKATGGNGLTGHDETSEDLGTAFVDQAAPTPGTKNACL